MSEKVADKNFYFDDGDCLFVAGNVLFKVHKMMLCRDPQSMFRDIFSVPQGTAVQTTDLAEIAVSDSAEEFRALCWAVYALPTDIQLQNDKGADINRLIAVSKMAHKYVLPSYEKWTLTMVWLHCQPGMDYLDGCSVDMSRRIFEAAVQGGREDLCKLVESRWLVRLNKGELELRDALDFGEMHNRRTFLGNAYYQQAVNMRGGFTPTAGCATDFSSQTNLKPEQLHRLLAGFCSLSLAFKDLESVKVPRVAGCHTGTSFSSYHPTGLLDGVDTTVAGGMNIWLAVEHAKKKQDYCKCRQSFLSSFVTGSVADHFLGKE
ncbi:hypothetical protein FB45DRAFT_823393 [Roridomyces roridus]|uniref:BTB domain-containing protein n=1 Tax=Roridomyces roridus TaxID=1738132 RepID=A0AAD7FUB3_9AGAR|nr:hypothetical protein FB45DRAFT_823393 [Roridomyces roridus]